MSSLSKWVISAILGLSWLGIENVSAQTQWPLHDDGLNNVVEWDHYSFKVNGKRTFLFAGEMHYWRLPVPEMWEDILQKMKAAGLNAFTFYANWAWHAPTPDTLDFESGAHNFTKLYSLAKRIGLYVLIRPGPYINAEANAGGFPLWLTDGTYGPLRDNNTQYTSAWAPYMSEFARLTVPHQITEGGNGLAFQIENEYGKQWIHVNNKTANETAAHYMQLLIDNARESGITIPLFHNNPNLNSWSWSEDYSPGFEGDVDVYGVDNYPSCWSCNLEECTGVNGAFVPYQVKYYYDHFQSVAWTQPEFMPEFQGGSYNPWGGPQGGCPSQSNQDFANLFYRHNIGERVTAMSLYMFYGGTNWGWFGAPVTATSYDYSAPISENRAIGAKFYETKNLALFTRIAEDLTMADRIGNGTQYSTVDSITVTELRNPLTNAGFYVAMHANSSSSSHESFKIRVSTSAGNLTIPQELPAMSLNGHQSKIIVTDFRFGEETLLYSTAEVLTYAIFDSSPVLVLWAPDGESGEFCVKGVNSGRVLRSDGSMDPTFQPNNGNLVVTFTNQKGMSILEIDGMSKIVILDRTSAYPFFVPSLSADPLAGPDEHVLVQGPYLVRSACIEEHGKTLALTGDILSPTIIETFANSSVETLTWNGQPLKTSKTSYGSLKGTIAQPKTTAFLPPKWSPWKMADSLPEISPTYNDSGHSWKSANHNTTKIPQKPETLPILYFDEYGFHQGIGIWRGYFSGNASGVFLSIQGGTAFGWSAWLNGKFLGSWLGNSTQYSQQGNLTLMFDNATKMDEGNVLVILQDNSGHDQTTGVLNPRGILNATLIGGGLFTHWKVAGTAGGQEKPLDPMRGVLNEGGLYGERQGWHLPGFDDSGWEKSSPAVNGLSEAGVRFYRTTMSIEVPKGLDVSLSFELNAPGSLKLRSLLFVNGYQYGRFNPYMGHQIDFPVPPGILNYNGNNTIALAVWAQSDEGAKVYIKAKVNYVVASSFDVTFDSDYLRPQWESSRLEYA